MSNGEGSVDRAIGRLEGRVSMVETQISNMDTRLTRQLNALAEEVYKLRDAIKTGTSWAKGNWHAITIISLCLFSVVSLIATLVNLTRHW